MAATLDSNVLIYAVLEPGSAKGERSVAMIARVAVRGVLAVQAPGEFLWATRRQRPEWSHRAMARVDFDRRTFKLVDTDPDLLLAAHELGARHQVPFWDAVILKAAARGGARLCLTEDLQDGATLYGVKIVNPFEPANAAELDRLLPA